MPPATITAPASASARCSRYVTPRHVQRASRRGLHVAAAATSSAPVSIFSPSKINLFLRVVRRREDGYHDLASLFHVIDLGDPMRFEMLPPTATQDVLTCSDTTIPTDASNLVIKVRNGRVCAMFLSCKDPIAQSMGYCLAAPHTALTRGMRQAQLRALLCALSTPSPPPLSCSARRCLLRPSPPADSLRLHFNACPPLPLSSPPPLLPPRPAPNRR